MQPVSSQPFRRASFDCLFQERRLLSDRFLFRRSVYINPVVPAPHHCANRNREASVAFNFDHAFRVFVSCQPAAAIRAVPGERIPGIFVFLHF